ncbi:peptide chain release factor H [Brucellaceae bacterium D45D]
MQSVNLLLSSGSGPAECRIALNRFVQILSEETHRRDCLFEISSEMAVDKHGPKSVFVTLQGDRADQIAQEFCGTVKFVFKSPVRPQHKRQNWFISVCRVARPQNDEITILPSDLRFETLRAGGPGGQHQNTTDSAVRVVHIPTGIQLTARNERSQHRNKAMALERLAMVLKHMKEDQTEDAKAALHRDNRNIQRGNEVKTFRC